jgi:predicted phosphodiesterase
MKKVISIICLLATIISMTTLGSLSASAAVGYTDEGMTIKDNSYTFIFIGDTQNLAYSDSHGTNHLNTMYEWIVENKDEKNIEFVFGLGDITESRGSALAYGEWDVALEAISKLNGVVPYSLVRGNHDDSNSFNLMFNTAAYKDQFSGYFYGETINNSYRTFTANGHNYLFMTLDYNANDAVISWANSVLRKYRDHRAIITTHVFLDGNGSLESYYGKSLWEKCFSLHSNVLMVVCGHVGVDGIVVSTQKGSKGNSVTAILIDPQEVDLGGASGLIMLMNVSENGEYCTIEYFSTVHGQYKIGSQRQLSLRGAKISAPKIFTTTESTTTLATTIAETTVGETEAEQGGCSSAIVSTVSAVCMIGTSLAAFAMRKKERED